MRENKQLTKEVTSATIGGNYVPSSNRHAIESRYKQAWREGQAESARLANDAQINWYRTHGYKVEIKK